MTLLVVVILVLIAIQIGIFIYSRKLRKRLKEENVLVKYDIKSRADAWKVLMSDDTPDSDKQEIERLMQDDDKS
jgi:uncharacterized membrane protein YqiK